MKSSFELAMERLNRSAPSKSLTADQKAAIAEIDSIYKAKIAEQEIRFRDQISEAESAGEADKAQELRDLFQTEKQKLNEQAEAKKAKVRENS
jgi:hypothetical protein